MGQDADRKRTSLGQEKDKKKTGLGQEEDKSRTRKGQEENRSRTGRGQVSDKKRTSLGQAGDKSRTRRGQQDTVVSLECWGSVFSPSVPSFKKSGLRDGTARQHDFRGERQYGCFLFSRHRQGRIQVLKSPSISSGPF